MGCAENKGSVGSDRSQNRNSEFPGGYRQREESKATKRMLLVPMMAVAALALALGQQPAEKKSPGQAKVAASGAIEQQIKDLEQQWNDATLKHDAEAMGRILADDVVDIDYTSQVHPKVERFIVCAGQHLIREVGIPESRPGSQNGELAATFHSSS